MKRAQYGVESSVAFPEYRVRRCVPAEIGGVRWLELVASCTTEAAAWAAWRLMHVDWLLDRMADGAPMIPMRRGMLSDLERWVLTLAQGPETTWVAPPVGERQLDHQRVIRVVDELYARGWLYLTRCGIDGEDNRYRITDEGRRALALDEGLS